MKQSKLTQQELFKKILGDWRKQEKEEVETSLQNMSKVKGLKGQQLDQILKILIEFHKNIGKADDKDVDPRWFDLSIALKKKLKKLQQTEQKQLKDKEIMCKKSQQKPIEYPSNLIEHKGPNQTILLKSLYKSFINNFEAAIKSNETVNFLQNLLKELRILFENEPQEQMLKRINSICLRLGREGSSEAKGKMMKGEIKAKQVALDNEETYFDQKAKEKLKQIQKDQLEESKIGFYDQMKKNINKDACEECNYCHEKKAYCEDMKQIRASDEPMTRFMRCNSCGKSWRD